MTDRISGSSRSKRASSAPLRRRANNPLALVTGRLLNRSGRPRRADAVASGDSTSLGSTFALNSRFVLTETYRQPGLRCTPQNLAQSSKFLGKKNIFGTKVTFEAFLTISQNLKVTHLQGCTQTKR